MGAHVFGCPIVATAGEVIFGFALGTSLLALRLAGPEASLAAEMGGKPVRDLFRGAPAWQALEPDWISLDPWRADVPLRRWIGDLDYFAERAAAHAESLSDAGG